MSDEKKYTERDLVLAKREGYVRHCTQLCGNEEMAVERAVGLFPIPKRVQPRVVKREGIVSCFLWRLVDGVLQWSDPDQIGWTTYRMDTPDEWRRVGPIYADLLATPTEEVDDA